MTVLAIGIALAGFCVGYGLCEIAQALENGLKTLVGDDD